MAHQTHPPLPLLAARFRLRLLPPHASIERWESGILVQDKASDLLLRQRTERGLYFNLRPAGRSKHTFAFP